MSFWIKIKAKIAMMASQEEVKELLEKSKKAIEQNYIENLYENEQANLKIEKLALEIEKKKIELELLKLKNFEEVSQLLEGKSFDTKDDDNNLKLYFNLNEFDTQEITDMLGGFSELYYGLSGDELEIKGMNINSFALVNTPILV